MEFGIKILEHNVKVRYKATLYNLCVAVLLLKEALYLLFYYVPK